LYLNTRNKTKYLFSQDHNNSIWYWYLTVATCFGISLDHFQANVKRTDFAFQISGSAWRWSNEIPKHIAIVRYQHHILLLCSWRNKLFVLLWLLDLICAVRSVLFQHHQARPTKGRSTENERNVRSGVNFQGSLRAKRRKTRATWKEQSTALIANILTAMETTKQTDAFGFIA
jgi:hypothetical protein